MSWPVPDINLRKFSCYAAAMFVYFKIDLLSMSFTNWSYFRISDSIASESSLSVFGGVAETLRKLGSKTNNWGFIFRDGKIQTNNKSMYKIYKQSIHLPAISIFCIVLYHTCVFFMLMRKRHKRSQDIPTSHGGWKRSKLCRHRKHWPIAKFLFLNTRKMIRSFKIFMKQ